ncbi:ribulose-phosphate 3-epimerase [Rhabdochlamydiaceae symbiont of Dictyostelium giganteum]|uniref:ribulose-phosphate 3-epimerase n=1 Tax=Rhabdochlamydiaceae symbiont of Dictyostelium giganteum TaxID=3342349 RepID=UPI00385143D8
MNKVDQSKTQIQKQIQVYPSILAADFGKLADEAKRAEDAGADGLHIDIIDGHFAPNFSLGAKAVADIRKSTSLFLDVHLMTYNPYGYIEQFVEAGAHGITFHFEATEDVLDTLNYIRKCRVKAGLAFSPDTSPEMILKYLKEADQILLMTVNPGFTGQPFLPEMVEKIHYVKTLSKALDAAPLIQVDGGINQETGLLCVKAGASILVSGQYLYQSKDMKGAIKSLKELNGS